MARILLGKFEDVWARGLVELLSREHHSVTVSAAGQPILSALTQRRERYDLLVLDISTDPENGLKLVKEIKRFRFQQNAALKVLCVSRPYRGPQFEFELEQQGARLIYVH